MPIKQVFESQEAIPEFLQSAVVEQDGKWIFEAETAQEVQALKGSLKKERDGRAQLQKAIQGTERFKPILEALGEADDEEITGFLESYKNRQANGGKPQPDPDAAKQAEYEKKLWEKERKKLADEVAQKGASLEAAQRELREYQLWTPMRELFIAANGDPKDWEVARLDLAARKVFDFDEDRKIVVMEDDGTPSTITPERFFKELYPDQRPKFYRASAAGGSGAPSQSSSGRGPKTMKRGDWNQLTPAKQAAFFKEGGTLTD